jgi:hypothetical protein
MAADMISRVAEGTKQGNESLAYSIVSTKHNDNGESKL